MTFRMPDSYYDPPDEPDLGQCEAVDNGKRCTNDATVHTEDGSKYCDEHEHWDDE